MTAGVPADGPGRVRAYYRALDTGEYGLLGDLLAPGFVHERPDATLEGRERFVRFMREQRPRTDTRHPVDAVYRRTDGDGEFVARGRLVGPDGETITGFVDAFWLAKGGIARIRTFTD